MFDDVTFAWWNDRNGNSQTFWAGSNAAHTCQCGIDHNCVDASVTCNCDVAAPVPLTDSGRPKSNVNLYQRLLRLMYHKAIPFNNGFYGLNIQTNSNIRHVIACVFSFM